jgi:hypothetical protein
MRIVKSDSTKRLKANNAKVMDVDLEELMEKLELIDLNCKKLWDVVSTLVV